jgi:uncharacterized protein YhaN
MRSIQSATLALSLLLLLPACSEDTVEAAGETYELFVRDLREASLAGYAELVEFTEETLVEIDARIAAVKQEIESMELDEAWNAKLAELEVERQKLGLKLDQLRAAGGAGWEQLREGAVEATEEARRAYDAAEQPPTPR